MLTKKQLLHVITYVIAATNVHSHLRLTLEAYKMKEIALHLKY